MKNFTFNLLLFIIIIVVFTMSSCKKGEDDPFISFRSRKARITGEWNLKSGIIVIKDHGLEETATYDGTYQYTPSYTHIYKEKWILNRNGTFQLNIDKLYENTTLEGSWSFGNKDKEFELKNKESVIFRVTYSNVISATTGGSHSETYTGTSCPVYSYIILQLKNKIMTIKIEESTTFNSWYTSTETKSGTMTFNQ